MTPLALTQVTVATQPFGPVNSEGSFSIVRAVVGAVGCKA